MEQEVRHGEKAVYAGVRLHRALLQSETPAFDDRLFKSYGVRTAGWISLSGCQQNRVQLSQRSAILDSAVARHDGGPHPCPTQIRSRELESLLLCQVTSLDVQRAYERPLRTDCVETIRRPIQAFENDSDPEAKSAKERG